MQELSPLELEKKEPFIEVPKLFHSTEYTEYELFVYTVIESLSRNPKEVAHTGVNQIINFVGMYKNSILQSKIKRTLESLKERELIQIYEDNLLTKVAEEIKPATTYFIKTLKKEKEKFFTKVFYSDFKNILELDDQYKVKIYRVYAEIMSYIFYNFSSDRVAFPNIETIHENTGIDRKSIMKYVKVLMDNKILFCLKVSIDYKKDKNFYSRWIHKNAVKRNIEYEFDGKEVEKEKISMIWEESKSVAA